MKWPVGFRPAEGQASSLAMNPVMTSSAAAHTCPEGPRYAPSSSGLKKSNRLALLARVRKHHS